MRNFFLSSLLLLNFICYFQTEEIQNSDDNLSENDMMTQLRQNCLSIERSVCIGQEKREIGLQSTEENLIGHWKFDNSLCIDSSKTKNDIVPPPKVGFSQGGNGQSGFFDNSYTSTIKHKEIYNSPEITIAFWLFLIENPKGEGWKTIIQKGNTSQDLTPTIQLWPNENRLHVKMSTDFDWNENVDSKSGILLKRWTHISITYSNMMVQIYINGILNNQLILQGQIKKNTGDFHIGKDPWHQGPFYYLDDLRIYNKILQKSEILGISQNISLNQGNSYAILGCESCSYQKAITSCDEKYHLCSFSEMYAGGYQIARSMGWFRQNPYFWVQLSEEKYSVEEAFMQELFDPNVYKVGICCQNK